MKRAFSVMCMSIVFSTLVFALASCGISKGDMERGIEHSFQEKMDIDPLYSKYKIKVQKVTLVKSASNKYDGLVSVTLNDETHNVGITVESAGKEFTWETKPLAFSFLVKYELENFDW